MVFGHHAIRLNPSAVIQKQVGAEYLGVNDSVEKEDRKEPLGHEKSSGGIVPLRVQLPQDGVSQFDETFRNASGAWIVHQLKESTEGGIIELIRGDRVLGIAWLDVDPGPGLVLGFFQQEGSILEDFHEVPFHVGPARPVPHGCPNIQNATEERIRACLGLRNQSGASGRPHVRSPEVFRGIRPSGVGKAGMN